MSSVKWIKIVTDVFDDEKILMIETMPEADTIIVIWFKLLCLAGKQNNSGVFQLGQMPYTDEMFSTIFRRPLNTVRLALKTFEQFGMVEIINDTVTIPNWGKHQNIDQIESKNAYMKKYMHEYREKQKLISSSKTNCKTNSKTNCKANVSSLDKIRKEKKRKDKNIEESSTPEPIRHKHGQYNNVLLSDEDLKKIQEEFPLDWNGRIERLSEYIASTGKSYKSHLATIRSWARKDSVPMKPKVPNGSAASSGQLGRAELENIKRLMED